MTIFDRIGDLFRQQKQVNENIFGYVTADSAPSLKAEDYVRAYRGWVYACVTAISEEVATLNLHLQQKTPEGWVEVEDSIVTRLLQDVNDFNTFTGLLVETSSFLELEGNSFWYLPQGEVTGKPAEIWFLNPKQVTVVKSKEKFIGGYKYRTGKMTEITLDPDEVIHFKRFNPLSKYRGMGTVEASALAIDIDRYSQEWNKNFFYNSAMPSSVLETAEELTDEQLERLKAEWKSRYTGLSNAHKLAILQGGLTYKPAQISQRDMEFLNQRKFSRDEILAIFRTPKTILGITEDVNRANAEASEYVFAKRVIKPKMQFITDHLNEFLLPMFDLDMQEWRFVFDDPVPENRELELKEYENGVKNYWLTSNEIREQEGLPPVSGGDSVYVPFSLYPIGSVEGKSIEKKKTKAKPNGDKAEQRRKRHLNIVKQRRNDLAELTKEEKGDWQKEYSKQYQQVVKRLKKYKPKVQLSAKPTKKAIKARVDDLITLVFLTDTQDKADVKGIAEKTLLTAFKRGGEQAIADLGLDNPFDTNQDIVADFIEQNALSEAKLITATQKREMSKLISDGVKEGKSTLQIAEDINRIDDDTSFWKSERIARTEVTRGYSQGGLLGAKQTGANFKQWFTVGDDRVDDNCFDNEADGAIPIDQAFTSGAYTPADEHANCRCALEYYVGNEFNFRTQSEANRITKEAVDKMTKDLKAQVKNTKDLIGKEADDIIGNARKQASKIVTDAKKEAKKEAKKITGDLKKLRADAMKQIYD